jgi:DNA-binding NarL/FixJ family response regulator
VIAPDLRAVAAGDDLRVVVADDHPVFRDGLAHLIGELEGIDVVAVAANGREAVELADRLAPDVIVMDLRMPELDGIEATRRVTAAHPAIGVVVLTMLEDDELLLAAVRAGARGYLLKDATEAEIATVLRGVARGEAIFGPGPAGRILDHIGTVAAGAGQPASHPFPQLTSREREVIELMARGHSNTQIARTLFLSERTVRNYVSIIFAKIHVPDRAHAIAAARDAGIASA